MDINLTFFGQMITFSILVLFTYKFVYPIIKLSIDERKKKIIEGLNSAKKGHLLLKKADIEYKKILNNAMTKSNEIILNANKKSDFMLDCVKKKALLEKKKILESSFSEINQEMNRIRFDLQNKMLKLIFYSVEKILLKKISLKDNLDFVNRIINRL